MRGVFKGVELGAGDLVALSPAVSFALLMFVRPHKKKKQQFILSFPAVLEYYRWWLRDLATEILHFHFVVHRWQR